MSHSEKMCAEKFNGKKSDINKSVKKTDTNGPTATT